MSDFPHHGSVAQLPNVYADLSLRYVGTSSNHSKNAKLTGVSKQVRVVQVTTLLHPCREEMGPTVVTTSPTGWESWPKK